MRRAVHHVLTKWRSCGLVRRRHDPTSTSSVVGLAGEMVFEAQWPRASRMGCRFWSRIGCVSILCLGVPVEGLGRLRVGPTLRACGWGSLADVGGLGCTDLGICRLHINAHSYLPPRYSARNGDRGQSGRGRNDRRRVGFWLFHPETPPGHDNAAGGLRSSWTPACAGVTGLLACIAFDRNFCNSYISHLPL